MGERKFKRDLFYFVTVAIAGRTKWHLYSYGRNPTERGKMKLQDRKKNSRATSLCRLQGMGYYIQMRSSPEGGT